jgi:hypothetical protein
MPSASERIAIIAKLGDFAKVRTAKRRLAGNLIKRVYEKRKPIVPPLPGAVYAAAHDMKHYGLKPDAFKVRMRWRNFSGWRLESRIVDVM